MQCFIMSFPFPRFRVTKPPCVLVSSPRPPPGPGNILKSQARPGWPAAASCDLGITRCRVAACSLHDHSEPTLTVFTLGKIKMPRNKWHIPTQAGTVGATKSGLRILIEITDHGSTALGQRLVCVW